MLLFFSQKDEVFLRKIKRKLNLLLLPLTMRQLWCTYSGNYKAEWVCAREKEKSCFPVNLLYNFIFNSKTKLSNLELFSYVIISVIVGAHKSNLAKWLETETKRKGKAQQENFQTFIYTTLVQSYSFFVWGRHDESKAIALFRKYKKRVSTRNLLVQERREKELSWNDTFVKVVKRWEKTKTQAHNNKNYMHHQHNQRTTDRRSYHRHHPCIYCT